MKKHFEEKHTNTTFKCDVCDKAFVTSEGLREHQRTHNSAYRFICQNARLSKGKVWLSTNRRKHIKSCLNLALSRSLRTTGIISWASTMSASSAPSSNKRFVHVTVFFVECFTGRSWMRFFFERGSSLLGVHTLRVFAEFVPASSGSS